MLDFSKNLELKPDEWLSVAARGSDGALTPGEILQLTTVVLRVKGSDLADYLAGRTDEGRGAGEGRGSSVLGRTEQNDRDGDKHTDAHGTALRDEVAQIAREPVRIHAMIRRRTVAALSVVLVRPCGERAAVHLSI